MSQKRILNSLRILLASALTLSACAIKRANLNVPDSAKPRLLWRHPGDIAARNLYYGPGGPEHAPKGKFKFVREIAEGSSPKFDVEDEQGVRWRVKPGTEARPETAATRLLWGAGYFTDENYFVPQLRVDGLKESTLTRGQRYVLEDGLIVNVRMERHAKDSKKVANWDWMDNPFSGTKEMDGLRIMMALLNNSDIKPLNNAVYEVKGAEYRYVVSDVGATFGRAGTSMSQTKDDLFAYCKARFIRKTTPEHVDFVLMERPAVIDVMFMPLYFRQTRRERIVKHIPREHARWLGEVLAQLSTKQLNDCFRAAGYMPEEVNGYTAAVKQRIAQLNRL